MDGTAVGDRAPRYLDTVTFQYRPVAGGPLPSHLGRETSDTPVRVGNWGVIVVVGERVVDGARSRD